MTGAELGRLQAQAEAEGKVCALGALIRDAQGRVFVQKRSLQRRLFPGCWDIVGGHLEAGETLPQALAREILEETGWQLSYLGPLLGVLEWKADGVGRLEFDFLVEVEGDLKRPVLESGKVSEHRWIGPRELKVLKENRQVDDLAIFRLVQQALSCATEN